VVDQELDELARVLVQNLGLVVVLLDEVVQLLVEIVEEHGVLVDVLQEVLIGSLAILLELDLTVGAVQIEHRVERVVIHVAVAADGGGYGSCVGDGRCHGDAPTGYVVCGALVRVGGASDFTFPEVLQSLADPHYVLGGAHQFEAVQIRNGALLRNDISRKAEGITEVRVSGSDDGSDQRTIVLVVEKLDHSLGDVVGVAPGVGGPSPVRRHDENVGRVDTKGAVRITQRDTCGRNVQLRDEAMSVLGRAGEVDQ